MSATPTSVAVDVTGELVAVARGAELVVERSLAGPPAFRRTMTDRVMALAFPGDGALVVLDRRGVLVELDALTGDVSRTTDVLPNATLFAAADKRVAVANAQQIAIVSNGESLPIDLRGATALAMTKTGDRLAVGTGAVVRVFDIEKMRAVGSCRTRDAVRALAFSERGYWIALTDKAIVRILPSGSEAQELCEHGEQDAKALACSTEGVFTAVRAGANRVVLFDAIIGKRRGTIDYVSEIAMVAFASSLALVVGLANGEIERFDLTQNGAAPRAGKADVDTEAMVRVRDRAAADGDARPELAARRSEQGGAAKFTWGTALAIFGFAALAVLLLALLTAVGSSR